MKLLFVLLLTVSNWSVSTVEEPKETHPKWVQEMIDTSPDITKIIRCEWNGKQVWKVNSCVMCNDMMTKIYDKDKNLLCEYGGVMKTNTCAEKNINYTNCKLVHRPSGGYIFGF